VSLLANLGRSLAGRPALRRTLIAMCVCFVAIVVGTVLLVVGVAGSETAPGGKVSTFSPTFWLGLLVFAVGGLGFLGFLYSARRRIDRERSPKARRAAEQMRSIATRRRSGRGATPDDR